MEIDWALARLVTFKPTKTQRNYQYKYILLFQIVKKYNLKDLSRKFQGKKRKNLLNNYLSYCLKSVNILLILKVFRILCLLIRVGKKA